MSTPHPFDAGVPVDAAALTHWNAQQGARTLCCPAHRCGIALVATEDDDALQWICPECGQCQPELGCRRHPSSGHAAGVHVPRLPSRHLGVE